MNNAAQIFNYIHVSLKQVEQFVSEPFLKSLDDCLAEVLEVGLRVLLRFFSTLFVILEISFA